MLAAFPGDRKTGTGRRCPVLASSSLSLSAFEPSMTWAKGLDFKFSDLGLHLFGLELFRWAELLDLDQ